MFGYIRLDKEELKIREYDHFRAYYCGLCLELKKRFGQSSRVLLNYDATFLALFLSSLTGTKEKVLPARCFLHPGKKRRIITDNTWLSYAADINVLLAYHSLKDHWMDDKSPAALIGLGVWHRAYRKAAGLHPELNDLIFRQTQELALLEKEKCPSLDAAADTFAKILAGLCPAMADPPAKVKAARRLCYNLGKWIYLIDALDDLPDDLKKGRYNPYLYAYDYRGEERTQFQDRIKPRAEFLLTYTLSQVAEAYGILDIGPNQGILENMIYLGMLKQTDDVLNRRSCVKGAKKLLRNSWCQGECLQRRNP